MSRATTAPATPHQGAAETEVRPGSGTAASAELHALADPSGHPSLLREVHLVDVADIHPGQFQPRKVFDEQAIAELSASIVQVGLLQPLVCRRASEGHWELVAGERRLRAARLAGLRHVPVLEWRDWPATDGPDVHLLAAAVVENLQRRDLTPLELACAYQQLSQEGLTSSQVGALVGRPADHVRAHLGLLRLPESVQGLLKSGVLSMGQVRPLCALADPAQCEALALRAVRENLTSRQVEETIACGGFAVTVRSKARRTTSKGSSPTRRFVDVEQVLEDVLETKVEVHGSTRGGYVKILFADAEDLVRLQELMRRPSAQGRNLA